MGLIFITQERKDSSVFNLAKELKKKFPLTNTDETKTVTITAVDLWIIFVLLSLNLVLMKPWPEGRTCCDLTPCVFTQRKRKPSETLRRFIHSVCPSVMNVVVVHRLLRSQGRLISHGLRLQTCLMGIQCFPDTGGTEITAKVNIRPLRDTLHHEDECEESLRVTLTPSLLP